MGRITPIFMGEYLCNLNTERLYWNAWKLLKES